MTTVFASEISGACPVSPEFVAEHSSACPAGVDRYDHAAKLPYVYIPWIRGGEWDGKSYECTGIATPNSLAIGNEKSAGRAIVAPRSFGNVLTVIA